MGIFSFGSSIYNDQKSKNKYPFLNELTVGGEKIDAEDDNYSVDNEEETDPEVEPGTDENAGGDQEQTEENQEAVDTPENDNTTEDTPQEDTPEPTADTGENTDDVDDDFALPEDTGEDGEAQTDDTGNETGEEAEGDTGADEFTMEDPEGGGEDAADTGEDGTDDGGDVDTTGTGADDTVGDTGTGQNDSELKQTEDQIYDTLTDDQKKIRVLQLKLGFKDLYQEADAVLNAINGIDKNEDNMETIRRLINVLNNVKQYILDYVSTVFDSNTYLDNNAVYVKYINVFRTIRKTIDELNKDQKS